MGCFKSACAISGRAIGYNEEVVGFIIARETKEKSHLPYYVYPWEEWGVVSDPIFSKYDDYGTLDVHDPKNNKAIQKFLKTFNQEYSSLFEEDDSMDRDFFEKTSFTRWGREIKFSLMIISRDVFDSIVGEIKDQDRLEAAVRNLYVIVNNKDEFEKMKISNAANISDEDFYLFNAKWKMRSFRDEMYLFADHENLIDFEKLGFKRYENKYNSPHAVWKELTPFSALSHSRESLWASSYATNTPLDFTEDEFVDMYFTVIQMGRLANAFLRLGKVVSPILYMSQNSNDNAIFDFTLNMIDNAIKRERIDEIDDGPAYDSETGEYYSMSVKMIGKLRKLLEKLEDEQKTHPDVLDEEEMEALYKERYGEE